MAKRDREEAKKGMADIFSSSGVDLVSAVVAGDRARTGRDKGATTENYDSMTSHNPPADYDNMTGHNATTDYDNTTSHNVIKQADIMTNKQADKRTDRQTDKRTDGQTTRRKSAATAQAPPAASPVAADTEAADIAQRAAEAQRLAASPTMTVTLRIPHLMNEWLDEYVHGAWREKIKKQDLVIEALRLLIARRGRSGEEVLPTELLPEE